MPSEAKHEFLAVSALHKQQPAPESLLTTVTGTSVELGMGYSYIQYIFVLIRLTNEMSFQGFMVDNQSSAMALRRLGTSTTPF